MFCRSFLLSLFYVSCFGIAFCRKLVFVDPDVDPANEASLVVRELTTMKKGYGAICTDAQIAKIDEANIFQGMRSNCPSRNWLDTVLKESKSRKEINLIVVGCNKGDDYVSLMEAFSGNKSYDVDAYVNYLTSIPSLYQFACAVAAKSILQPNYPVKPIRGFCIEPLKGNYDLLTTGMSKLGLDPSSSHVIQMALDIFPGTADFPEVEIGKENVGLGDSSGYEKYYEVRVDNLDNFIDEQHIDSTIDFVSIDAEGFDANVLLGFSRSLFSKNIRFFEFEYHNVRRWSSADLQLISDMLDLAGFDCFFQGNNNELWRLTGMSKV